MFQDLACSPGRRFLLAITENGRDSDSEQRTGVLLLGLADNLHFDFVLAFDVPLTHARRTQDGLQAGSVSDTSRAETVMAALLPLWTASVVVEARRLCRWRVRQ